MIYIVFPISWPAPPIHDQQRFLKKMRNFPVVPRGTKIFDQSDFCILPLFSNFGAGPDSSWLQRKAKVCCVMCAFVVCACVMCVFAFIFAFDLLLFLL